MDNPQAAQVGARDQQGPVGLFLRHPGCPASRTVRLETHCKSVLVRRVPLRNMVQSSGKRFALLDRRAASLDWSKQRGRLVIFVRALQVLGKDLEGCSAMGMQISQQSHRVLEHAFLHDFQEIGARFRGGEAADLIFLAQLTPPGDSCADLGGLP